MRPIIGITSYAQEARFGAWELPSALIPLSYVDSVELAGGRGVVIPPTENGAEDTLNILDGLILSGGADIDPAHYGSDGHELTLAQPERDRAEFALLEGAFARDMPVLGICRGMQLLNVARGGSLHQHLPELVGHDEHRTTPGVFSTHEVRIDPASRTGAALGASATVKSSHHQGVVSVGEGLVPVGVAHDGTVEVIEDPCRSFAVGVLWHPEEDDDKRLFEALVAAARAYRATRR